MKVSRLIPLCLLPLFSVSAFGAAPPADDLVAGFESPPDSSKPLTWWHWVSGNVSSEGITADLNAMKQIGLGGAQIFTVDQSQVKGPVVFLSPEWRKLMHQSLVEASHLHLLIGMEGCDGWSESGGHWVTPAQSMQKVVWSDRQVTGGRKIALDVPQPPTVLGYYEDIALYAFPTPDGDDLPAPEQITTSAPGFVTRKTGPSASEPIHVGNSGNGAPVWVQYEYANPVTCGSLELATKGQDHLTGEVQVSDDGVSFRSAGTVRGQGSSSFPSVKAKVFRVLFDRARISKNGMDITEMNLGGGRVPELAARSGLSVRPWLAFGDDTLPADEVIDPKALVDLTGKKEWDAPAGKWTLLRVGHTSTGATTHPSTKPGLECDKMSRAAVESHIEHLYTPVWQDNPGLVGSTFRYILLDSWEAGGENWTELLPREFTKLWGYDPRPWLPALTGRVILNLDATERFLWDYRRTLADMVAENHYGTFQEVAHAHHMELSSEAPGIGKPTVGDGLQCKGRCDLPMGEFWVNQNWNNNVDDPSEAASAAHIYGQNIAATESFTSTPQVAAWANDPYSLKMEGDKEFCLGVNDFIFHRYAHQPWMDRVPGMSMGPWGINFERTNTWWNEGSAWIRYITRSQYLLRRGRYDADLCYFYGEGAPIFYDHTQMKPAVPQGYASDACNAEIFLHQMSVEDGRIALKSGMRYRVLVLPDTDRMTLPVLSKIESLVRAGAVVYGPRPVKSPSLAGYPGNDRAVSDLANKVWGPCDGKTVTEHAYGNGKIAWGEPLEKVLAVQPDFTSTAPNMLYIHRKDDPADIYFVSNQQGTEVNAACTFRVTGRMPELWHPDSGKMETVALYQTGEGKTTLPIHFDPSGSVFVVFRQPRTEPAPVATVKWNGQDAYASGTDSIATLPVVDGDKLKLAAFQSGEYEVSGSGNSVKLTVPALPARQEIDGPWQLTFPPKLGAPEKATLDHLISWTDSSDDGIKYFSGTATYRRDFNLSPDRFGKDRRIFLDLGKVKNLAEVTLNGKSLGILWKPPFRVDVTDAARAGTNQLEIKITDLWPNRLIGDQRLPENKRITWASVSLYKPDSPLLASGLLGPVTLSSAGELEWSMR